MDKPDALSWYPDHRDGSGNNLDLVLPKPELFTIQALERVTFKEVEQDILREIRAKNWKQAWEDSVAIIVKVLKNFKANSINSAKWKLQDGLLYHQDLRVLLALLCIMELSSSLSPLFLCFAFLCSIKPSPKPSCCCHELEEMFEHALCQYQPCYVPCCIPHSCS
jgi:hypothetical protein